MQEFIALCNQAESSKAELEALKKSNRHLKKRVTQLETDLRFASLQGCAGPEYLAAKSEFGAQAEESVVRRE
jgi:hypothetical protein